jgi:ankyrin repeat protein
MYVYYAKQQYYDGYISLEDYERVGDLGKILCKIKSDLIKRSSNDHNAEPPVINAQDISAMLNETPTSCQAVSREDNNQLNIKRDPECESTDSQQVIDKAQKTINEYNDDGFTRLHVAAQEGDVELGRYLLQCGANIEITSKAKVGGNTALHLAARNGHKDFVKFLLHSGENVNSVSSTGSGVTPLHEAAYDGHLDVAKLLIERSATVDAKDRHNVTPLMYASAQGNSAVVKLLLSKKADFYLQNFNDETALHSAADNGHSDVVAILIGAAKDKEKYVNMQSNIIGTALHVIAYNREINEGHKESVKLLIDNGTSPHFENEPAINTPKDTFWKVSSLDMAKKRENKEFLEFMSSLGYLVTVDCIPSNSNNASLNTKRYVTAAATLAIAGIISGVAVAVYLEMLAVGIAVGACCLVAAAVIYSCTPKSSVESKNVTKLTGDEFAAQQTVN